VSITTRALLEAVLLGAACGPLGVWVLAFRQGYAAESLAHAMLPGLAVAAVAGAPILLGAAGGVIAAAVLVALAARDRRIGGELAIAVIVTAAFGTGALIALSPDAPARLGDLLFGDLLGVTDGDLIAAALLAVGLPATLAAAHRPLTVAVLDPHVAPALGTDPARALALLLVLIGLAVVVAVQGLGNLLVVALLVAPAAGAGRLRARLAHQLVLAAVIGAGSGALGVWASSELDVAAGAAVALVACLTALAVLVAAPGGRRAALRRSPIEALAGRG
jgi:ABC-type Mn2+/Zn2+ transport system permease subunit